MTTVRRVEQALTTAGLRHLVAGVEKNHAGRGEVVLWINGTGHPVWSPREALTLVAGFRALSD